MKKESAIVLLSGGQDSTTALFWAKKIFKKVIAISFDYGQKHKIELNAAKKIAKIAKVKHIIIELKEFKKINESALIKRKMSITKKHKFDKNLPATFVPGRNIIFLTVAASFAWVKRIKNLVIGVSQVDYSGYPDCRKDFIKAIEKSLELGLDYKIKIYTPLIDKKKKDIVLLAKNLGILNLMKDTYTCYKGGKKPCGKCPACKLRQKGFKEAGILDPLYFKK